MKVFFGRWSYTYQSILYETLARDLVKCVEERLAVFCSHASRYMFFSSTHQCPVLVSTGISGVTSGPAIAAAGLAVVVCFVVHGVCAVTIASIMRY